MKLDTVCSIFQCFSSELISNQVAVLDSTVLWMNATWFMVRLLSKRTMLTGGFFVLLLRLVFFYGLPGCPCLHFLSFSPSLCGPTGSLWGGAVVVRGHPGDTPGFPTEI